jgi:hypothetical protein
MMAPVNRTLLAFLVAIPVAAAIGAASGLLDLDSGVVTLLAVVAAMPVTLLDREGFYGRPPSR